MKKAFLYLYPIKEYTSMFLFHDDKLYEEWNVPKPLPILNETINKRYREKGYQIIFALYLDKEIYGVEPKKEDVIIYTDVTFCEASACDESGNEKKDFIPKYPSERHLLQQIGPIDELVVGGYHAMDCVKRVAEFALKSGINTLVDLDLTDLFFNVYKQQDYFDIESYSPEKFKAHIINSAEEEYREFEERIFNRNYSSPVYGFSNDIIKKL